MTDDDRVLAFPRACLSKRACPICGKPGKPGHRPFCSQRCRQVDLGRWLKGSYRIPTDESPAEGEAAPDDEQ